MDHIFSETEDPWKLTAAISGAHTIGQAQSHTSGWDGMWSDPTNQGIFNNNYYKSMVTKGWVPEMDMGGIINKNQWQRADAGSNPNVKEMMLDTDLCLLYNSNTVMATCRKRDIPCKDYVGMGDPLTAENGQCCAWIDDNILYEKGVLTKGIKEHMCGQQLETN